MDLLINIQIHNIQACKVALNQTYLRTHMLEPWSLFNVRLVAAKSLYEHPDMNAVVILKRNFTGSTVCS